MMILGVCDDTVRDAFHPLTEPLACLQILQRLAPRVESPATLGLPGRLPLCLAVSQLPQ
jgi:hypothetical protein